MLVLVTNFILLMWHRSTALKANDNNIDPLDKNLSTQSSLEVDLLNIQTFWKRALGFSFSAIFQIVFCQKRLRFCCLLRFACGFFVFGVCWFSVCVKNTSGFSVFVSDEDFGFSYFFLFAFRFLFHLSPTCHDCIGFYRNCKRFSALA